MEPCSLLAPAELSALAGVAVVEVRARGTALDGSACSYLAEEPFVVTLGILSTAGFESLRHDYEGEPSPGVGVDALVRGPDALGDVAVYARDRQAAVFVQISGVRAGEAARERRQQAVEIARRALDRMGDDPW